MALQINEDELGTILAEVDRELSGALDDARSRLNKADDEKSASASSSPPGEASSSASSSPGGDAGGPPAEGSDAPPGADASAPPASPSADAGAPPMDPSAAPPADGSAGPGAPEDLESKLAALPEDQLRHLYMAAKQALFARMQSAGPQASPAAPPGAPPAAPPAGPSASPAMPPPALKAEASASASPAVKGEMKASPANGGGKTSAIKVGKSEGSEDNLMKSEDEISLLKAQLDEQKKMTEGLMKAVTMLGAPLRKAVTSVAHLPKPGDPGKDSKPLSKAEVTEKLKALDLKKTTPKDREAINGFYDGRFGLDKIAHLLG